MEDAMLFKVVCILSLGFAAYRPASISAVASPIKENPSKTLNDETIRRMKIPTCGFEDLLRKQSSRKNSTLQKYQLYGDKLQKTHITYGFLKYTNQLDYSVVHDAIRQAFDVWSAVIPLTFEQKTSGSADMYIGFYGNQHLMPNEQPCTNFDYDNKNALAHASYPSAAPIPFLHFNDGYPWTVGWNPGAYDLFQVAVHEIGHSLGLSHSELPGSVMNSAFNYNPNFQLSNDDISGVQALYGVKGENGENEWQYDSYEDYQ